MDDLSKFQLEELLVSAPGSLLKIAIDDSLTILFAPEAFYSLVKNEVNRSESTLLPLVRFVYSADIISVTQQLANQKHRKDDMLWFHFRSLQSDGRFKWIMITGKRMQEIYSSGTKQVPVYACMVVDITDYMLQLKRLEQKTDHYRAITELSRDLYYEYEIATDTLTFSELFYEVFGKDAVIHGFREKLKKTPLIHPDELPAVIKIFNSMMGGRKQARFEIRMFPKDGKSCWYICYASIILDENKNPYKVVGKLTTLNQTKKESQEPVFEPMTDSLTGVYTRETAEHLIIEAMKKLQKKTLSALMLLEVRNYKNISEIRRSIDGENVLTAAGRILKNYFRTTDIIGRTGLSEFVVFISGLPTDCMAYDIAEQLCRRMEEQHSYKHTKSGLAISIGLTVVRGEQDYQTMAANANAALVMAKKVPSSSFEIFNVNVK